MIRERVSMLGITVDVLEWDGNEEELRSFGPDQFRGINAGVAEMGSLHPLGGRFLRHGDILVRPAGRTDISPLHLFRDSWWTTELGLLG